MSVDQAAPRLLGGYSRIDAPGLWARARAHAWLLFLTAGMLAAVLAALFGDDESIQGPLNICSLVSVAAILVGVRLNCPERPMAWWLIATCTLLCAIGIGFLPTEGATAIYGEILTGLGYLAAIIGFVILIRGRIPGGDRGAFLDAAIVAAGAAVVIWTMGFADALAGARQGTLVAAVFFFAVMIASGTVIRMWFMPGAHRPATRLIVMLVVVSNSIFVLDMLREMTGVTAFVAPHLFAEFASLGIVGAAALHPSMALAPERQRRGLRAIGRRRLAALTLALLVNPATLGFQYLMSGGFVDPMPYMAGAVVIGVLVIARLGDVLGQLGDSLRERESLTDLLRRQALFDGLTGLPNRSLFEERLTSALAARTPGSSLAVLLVDLDDFKAVNDTYGHATGDSLLVQVADRLSSCVREGDTVARFGGDEFIVILPSCSDGDVAEEIAKRIVVSLGQSYRLGFRDVRASASVGVALAASDDRKAEHVVRNADLAMYVAKARGRGRYDVFKAGMEAAAATKLQMRADLEAGISHGELRLHFQPVVDLRTNQTIGLEALVRWQRPDGLIAPNDFIPLAESSGLIGQVTDWVVREACRTAATWGTGDDLPWVSVNIPSSQLLRDDLVVRLRASLEATRLPASRLVVEITESSLLEIDVARPALERLREIGVRVAIDDFGTGYSALSYLARLAVDIVKIDRSFVAALEAAGPEEAITSAIIDLSRRLGLTTIGEGIETESQLAQLRALGCDLGQGYLLSYPVPSHQLPPIGRPGLPRPARPTAIRGSRTRAVEGVPA